LKSGADATEHSSRRGVEGHDLNGSNEGVDEPMKALGTSLVGTEAHFRQGHGAEADFGRSAFGEAFTDAALTATNKAHGVGAQHEPSVGHAKGSWLESGLPCFDISVSKCVESKQLETSLRNDQAMIGGEPEVIYRGLAGYLEPLKCRKVEVGVQLHELFGQRNLNRREHKTAEARRS
jgi:hypothetical protein